MEMGLRPLAQPRRHTSGIGRHGCGVLMAEGGRRCKLTGHTGFAGAMEHILADPSVSAGVEKIAVSRPVAAARIEYRAGEGLTEQRFGRAPAALAWVESLLDGGVITRLIEPTKLVIAPAILDTPIAAKLPAKLLNAEAELFTAMVRPFTSFSVLPRAALSFLALAAAFSDCRLILMLISDIILYFLLILFLNLLISLKH